MKNEWLFLPLTCRKYQKRNEAIEGPFAKGKCWWIRKVGIVMEGSDVRIIVNGKSKLLWDS